jgi:hypothetical protein
VIERLAASLHDEEPALVTAYQKVIFGAPIESPRS